jgi:glycerophosphoryl diester phosphodiesterase
MSLSWPSVAKLRELRPGWKAGVLAAKTYGSLDGLEADFVAVSRGNAKPAFLRAAAAAEKQVYVWTLNDRLAIADALGGGASGVITDRPGLAREVIERRAAMSSAERLVLRAALTLGLERDETPEQ